MCIATSKGSDMYIHIAEIVRLSVSIIQQVFYKLLVNRQKWQNKTE